jgi:hypothetical protein
MLQMGLLGDCQRWSRNLLECDEGSHVDRSIEAFVLAEHLAAPYRKEHW